MWQALVFLYKYHYGAQGNGTRLSFSAAVVLCKWYMTAAVCTTVSLLSPALLSQTDALSEAELFVKLIRLRT